MSKNYRAELVGVFGDPVDENPTGVMEEAAFAARGLNYRYLNFKLEKGRLKEAMEAVSLLNMRGINLTIPHKVDVIPYLDVLSPAAQITGAVNTVINDNGRLTGENTDGKGFLTALEEAGVSVSHKWITILGAGGAARAISVECALAGAKHITIINRDAERGGALVELLSRKTPAEAEYLPWTAAVRIPDGTDILVNATCVGLYPNTDEKPDIDYSRISSRMVVTDVVFNDPNTLFLQEAGKRAHKTVDGLGMLVHQGAINFTLWTGVEAPVAIMKDALKKEFGL